MDKEQIQIRLAGYRPEIYQDDDPRIADALQAARADPDLSTWLDDQIAFDRRFATALRGCPADGEGVESVLRAASRRRFRRAPVITLTLAAAAVLLLGGFLVKFFLFPPPVQFVGAASETVPGFRDAMAYFANQRFVLDERTGDLEEARTWLAGHGWPAYANTPENILRYKGMGCKAIDWRGTKVSLVCFRNEHDDVVHLFVVDAEELAAADDANLGRLQRLRGLETQGWQDEHFVYLFVASGPEVSLAGLL